MALTLGWYANDLVEVIFPTHSLHATEEDAVHGAPGRVDGSQMRGAGLTHRDRESGKYNTCAGGHQWRCQFEKGGSEFGNPH